jgi:hypothetical protein
MKVEVLEEHGYDLALRGMAYSFKDRAEPVDTWWPEKRERAKQRAPKLAPMEGGHNKLLESITVYIDIEAPRAWWSEFDTYRVGMTKQSESTMHTLSKRAPTKDDFEEGTPEYMIETFIATWHVWKGDIHKLKMSLPEGFLQRRMVVTNYKVLKNILAQRQGHRLKLWQVFEDAILTGVQHPEFLKVSEKHVSV